jgi:dienelactone hydrolase
MRLLLPAALAGCLLTAPAARGDEPSAEKGTVRFVPLGDQKEVPERYRLSAHEFPFELTKTRALPASGLDVYHLCFPSPVHSSCPENNTVHADYYRPRGAGPFPGVIVLDILAGDQRVARTVAAHLAQNGIAALHVQMAYYGQRRPPGSRLRLLSPDLDQTFEAVRQTVLDLRRAAAWLESRREIDAHNLGIVGTSLGSFMAALTAEMEPKLGRVAVLLGGGGFVDAFYDDPRVALVRQAWEALGGTKEQIARVIAPADPLTCAANLKGRKVLIIAARHDTIVPPCMAEALWRATGRQQIVWYDCNHYTAVLYIVPGLRHVVEHFRAKGAAAGG